jgi:hypothetical protein
MNKIIIYLAFKIIAAILLSISKKFKILKYKIVNNYNKQKIILLMNLVKFFKNIQIYFKNPLMKIK